MSFESITNRAEFFSNHYLDVVIGNDIGGIRGEWDELEKHHKSTARSRLKGLGKTFFDARASLTESSAAGRVTALHELNRAVIAALGFTVDPKTLTLTMSDVETLDVPVTATAETPTGLLIAVLEAGPATEIDELFDDEGSDGSGVGIGTIANLLLDPVWRVEHKKQVVSATASVGELFACEKPPRYVVIVAGGMVLLAERAKWAEGRFLAVDLDAVLERNDTRKGGEIEMVAALFSTDVLVPTDGASVFDDLVDKSHKHAVGVSKDLRHGLRQSVEIIANEVIERLDERAREQKKAQFSRSDIDPKDLTRQTLRWLYRLVVLLFAESRPELGVVPVDDDAYLAGYSLDRLRELCLVDLDTDHARNGTHLHESLQRLFSLVNDGYHAEHAQQMLELGSQGDDGETSREEYLQFPGLDAGIFDPSATPLLEQVKFRNEAVQHVLRLLMVGSSGTGKKREIQFISYSQLGINQLGAVYEGLMAYSGFFADRDLYEVAKNGDPSGGTWVLPVDDADGYDEDVFVKHEDPTTGREIRILHPRGSYVYRLSGRDRQRSASYYTPEVLTRCVVKHALAELLGLDRLAPEGGSAGITEAKQLLDLTICEPALGSGAFANEAINQLSAQYLQMRQRELGETLDAETYQRELQKVKAHFALHQTYGVDLNPTAIELAEVSLWLNCMHPGLKAPWFGLQLRAGNSLIGCRRATWRATQLDTRPWARTKKGEVSPPLDRRLSDGPLDRDEIHHFLLPGHGWGAVAARKEAKEFRPRETEALRAWRTAILKAPSKADATRLIALAERVEDLWASAETRIRLTQEAIRRPLAIYGTDSVSRAPISRAAAERVLNDSNSALGRLRMLMDAWVGLWFWPLDASCQPPSWKEWLTAVEAIAAVGTGEPTGQLEMFDNFEQIEAYQMSASSESTSGDVVQGHPWLGVAVGAARTEGAWHWELEFSPTFSTGGFDVIVGNPPWVVWSWDHDAVLAEYDPSVALISNSGDLNHRLSARAEVEVIGQLVAHAGVESFGRDADLYPASSGSQLNLYQSFIECAAHLVNRSGSVGLIHPASHLSDKDSVLLRSFSFDRLRRLFNFINQRRLFEDVGNAVPFSVSIFGAARSALSFLYLGNLIETTTIDESIQDDSLDGETPPQKDENGDWITVGSQRRIVHVESQDLRVWSQFFTADDGGHDVRLLNLHSVAEKVAIRVIATAPVRLFNFATESKEGASEAQLLGAGAITRGPNRPGSLAQAVFQSPNVSALNPLYQESNERAANHRDYRPFESLAGRLPLLRFGRPRGSVPTEEFVIYYKRWIDPKGERVMHAGTLPSGAITLAPISTLRGIQDVSDYAFIAGALSSLPVDYVARIQNRPNLYWDAIMGLPLPDKKNTSVYKAISLRSSRLNCLVDEYSALWDATWDPDWLSDSWTSAGFAESSLVIGDMRRWGLAVPLVTPGDRWKAMVEIDALVSIGLGLDIHDVCEIYRTQFTVMRKYEGSLYFDAAGRSISRFHQAASSLQLDLQSRAGRGELPAPWASVWGLLQSHLSGDEPVDWMGNYTPPFTRADREAEMTRAYNVFKHRFAERDAKA